MASKSSAFFDFFCKKFITQTKRAGCEPKKIRQQSDQIFSPHHRVAKAPQPIQNTQNHPVTTSRRSHPTRFHPVTTSRRSHPTRFHPVTTSRRSHPTRFHPVTTSRRSPPNTVPPGQDLAAPPPCALPPGHHLVALPPTTLPPGHVLAVFGRGFLPLMGQKIFLCKTLKSNGLINFLKKRAKTAELFSSFLHINIYRGSCFGTVLRLRFSCSSGWLPFHHLDGLFVVSTLVFC